MHLCYYNYCHTTAPCSNGDVRLHGSPINRAGVVHVCINGTWGKVCGGEHNPEFASIVCSQLGYSPYGMYVIVTVIQWEPRN